MPIIGLFIGRRLRAKTRIVGGNGNDGIPFIMHLKETLAENKPYDDWVHDMLAAMGRFGRGNERWAITTEMQEWARTACPTPSVFFWNKLECLMS